MTKPNIIILLGPPGCGKGTHAPLLSKHLHIPHISTGDLFRENIRNLTPIGQKAKSYIDAGQLVPDSVVLEMLFDRFSKDDCQMGAILDGVPRTIPQAESLMDKFGESFQFKVIQFSIDFNLLVDRICGRIACKQCGKPYHKKYSPPKTEGICDDCHGPLFQRVDDTEDLLKQRLQAYTEQTQPLVGFYKKFPGMYFEINAGLTKEDVFKEILAIFK